MCVLVARKPTTIYYCVVAARVQMLSNMGYSVEQAEAALDQTAKGSTEENHVARAANLLTEVL